MSHHNLAIPSWRPHRRRIRQGTVSSCHGALRSRRLFLPPRITAKRAICQDQCHFLVLFLFFYLLHILNAEICLKRKSGLDHHDSVGAPRKLALHRESLCRTGSLLAVYISYLRQHVPVCCESYHIPKYIEALFLCLAVNDVSCIRHSRHPPPLN